jgi:hypothetical protein
MLLVNWRPFFRLLAGLILALVLPRFCIAEEARTVQPWGLEALMAELGRVQHSKARFVERKYLKILTKPLELTGTLEYRAPDRLERHTLTPQRESFVVEGDRVVLENAQGRRRTLQLQDNTVLWAFVESIRSTLSGDAGMLNRFYAVMLEGDLAKWRLSLTPKELRMRSFISVIQIGGSGSKVDSVEIQETQGDRSVMTVHEDGS